MIRLSLRFLFSRRRARAFIAAQRHEDLVQLADLMASGRLRTVIDTVYPLDDIATAMDHLATGHVRGKVIINP